MVTLPVLGPIVFVGTVFSPVLAVAILVGVPLTVVQTVGDWRRRWLRRPIDEEAVVRHLVEKGGYSESFARRMIAASKGEISHEQLGDESATYEHD